MHRALTLRDIAQAATRVSGYSLAELRGPVRGKPIANVRTAYMRVARRLTARSFAQIGDFVGRCDHTTVHHAMKTKKHWEQESRIIDLEHLIEREIKRVMMLERVRISKGRDGTIYRVRRLRHVVAARCELPAQKPLRPQMPLPGAMRKPDPIIQWGAVT